jgi:hypothetical protein
VNEKCLKIIVEKIGMEKMRFPNRIKPKDYVPQDNEFYLTGGVFELP